MLEIKIAKVKILKISIPKVNSHDINCYSKYSGYQLLKYMLTISSIRIIMIMISTAIAHYLGYQLLKDNLLI